MAADILKTASSSSSPFAVFTSSSCTSGLNSTCGGRGQSARDSPGPSRLSTWAAHLRLLLSRERIVIAVSSSGLTKRRGGGAKRRDDRNSSRGGLPHTQLSALSVHLTSLWPCRSYPVGTGTRVLCHTGQAVPARLTQAGAGEQSCSWHRFWSVPLRGVSAAAVWACRCDGSHHCISSSQTAAEMLAIGLKLESGALTELMKRGPHLLAPTGYTMSMT